MAKQLSDRMRGQIIALSNEGTSQCKIAKKIKVSKGAVQRTLERFRQIESYSTKSRSGRPRATTSKEDQYIKILSLRNRTATASNIQSIVNTTRDKSVSWSTVRRTLVEHGLKGRVAVSKPLLRARKLLLWLENIDVPLKKIGKMFSLQMNPNSKYTETNDAFMLDVETRKNENFESFCIKPMVKHGGGSIQVWGCFSYNGVDDLYKIIKTEEKKQYHSILQRYAIPSGLRLCGKGFVLLPYNDPKHTSHLCKNYLKRKER